MMRRLISAGSQIAQLGYEGGPDPDAVLDHAEDLLFKLRRNDRVKDFASIRQILDEYLARSARPVSAGAEAGQLPRIPTGYPALDSLLGGLHRSDLIIVAARPGVGKSALALGFARNGAVRHKARVAMFCLEMSAEQMVER
ncbi:MAG: replicative DNA helicase, partial [Chloroflexi bacterium]|nr:replicative DNA helicase [Chloroflexota bacterium]